MIDAFTCIPGRICGGGKIVADLREELRIALAENTDDDTWPTFNIITGEIMDPNGMLEDLGDGWYKMKTTGD